MTAAFSGALSRTYPHPVEPNDPARKGQPAGPAIRFGCYEAYPIHTRSGAWRWIVEDARVIQRRWTDEDDALVRMGHSFDEVTRDFADLFAEGSR
jgi:hypothetical protein